MIKKISAHSCFFPINVSKLSRKGVYFILLLASCNKLLSSCCEDKAKKGE